MANGFDKSSTFDSTKLHQWPGVQSQAAAAVVTKDTDMDTSLRDLLVQQCCKSRANGFTKSSTFDSTKLHERPGIQSQAAAAAVVTMDTDMDTSLRDRSCATMLQECGKRPRLHSTLAITEMLSGC